MHWLKLLIPSGITASDTGLAMVALTIVLGLALGAVRVKGIRLGIAGVLFSGLLFGQLGFTMNPVALQFLRDFSLVIFMYAIGLQVGPGFFASLKSQGLRLNILSLVVIALAVLMTAAIVRPGWTPKVVASGLYTGAFTTTPGLAAGQEALRQKITNIPARDSALAMTGLAYAVTYPFGIIGPILVIILLRRLFRVRIEDELAIHTASRDRHRPPVVVLDFEVTHPDHAGIVLSQHPLLNKKSIVLSRLLRDGQMTVPTADTEIRLGDIYRAVGPRNELNEFIEKIGKPAQTDFGKIDGDVHRIDLVVTRTAILRRSLRELDFIRRTGVTIARVNRAGIELTPKALLTFHFGDQVTAVGPEQGLKIVETELGNSSDSVNRPQLIPIFLGVVLGVLVGGIPLAIPGLHASVRIGLAGGPMLAAIALAQLGNVGSVVWYMPAPASQLFRDFGLSVFLACVGLQAGGHFLQNLAHGGFVFVFWGAIITFVPVFVVACIARLVWKIDFVTLSGWVAGAMTCIPALMFADDMVKSDAPAVAYAAVAPLAILTPVICAQLLVVAM